MNTARVNIRPMNEEDLQTVAGIEKASFEDPWPRSAFADMISGRRRFNLVLANGDDRPLAYVCAACVADELQIHNIAVDPAKRRMGYGRSLMEAAEAEGRRRGALGAVLDVRATNTAALAMYGEFGYRRIGRRKNYYRKPVGDALVLFKPLVKETGDTDGLVS